MVSFLLSEMDSDDATLCLDDIRSVRLVVNEILKITRKIGGVGGDRPASSSSLSPSSVTPMTPRDHEYLLSLSSQISELGIKVERTSLVTQSICTPPMTNESMIAQGLEQEEASLVCQGELSSLLGLREASWTLLLAFLAVWFSVVLLTLIWMRLSDLRYKPRVVSLIFAYSF